MGPAFWFGCIVLPSVSGIIAGPGTPGAPVPLPAGCPSSPFWSQAEGSLSPLTPYWGAGALSVLRCSPLSLLSLLAVAAVALHTPPPTPPDLSPQGPMGWLRTQWPLVRHCLWCWGFPSTPGQPEAEQRLSLPAPRSALPTWGLRPQECPLPLPAPAHPATLGGLQGGGGRGGCISPGMLSPTATLSLGVPQACALTQSGWSQGQPSVQVESVCKCPPCPLPQSWREQVPNPKAGQALPNAAGVRGGTQSRQQ